MRFAVLSRNPGLYSTSRLVLAARARGHRVDVLHPLELQLAVVGRTTLLLHRGEKLPRYQAVIPRIGTTITRYGIAIIREFERSASTTVVNGSRAIELSRDKMRCLSDLARQRLRVPATVALRSAAGIDQTVELLGGYPVIVKLQNGTHGVGTMVADSRPALTSLVETFAAMSQDVILQQYVAEARGQDLRALVVGGRVVAAMRRSATGEEFRSNLHRGGVSEAITLSPAFRRCAERAAKLTNLQLVGVDMLESKAGPMVLELNSSPGLEGIEQVTQIDIASKVIAHAENLNEGLAQCS